MNYLKLITILQLISLVTCLKTSDNHNLNPFIVGGVPAARNEFPWLVNLRFEGQGLDYFCGGVLIRMDVVLTNAYCVYNPNFDPTVIVKAGDFLFEDEDEGEQILRSKRIKVHEGFNAYFENNIALVFLDGNFTKSESVGVIGLPLGDFVIPEGTLGTIAGWGSTVPVDPSLSPVLMKVDVPVVPNEHQNCSRLLTDPEGQFCAGVVGKDVGFGDEGGPLICHNSPGVVCGIYSHGEGFGNIGRPGVYTKVAKYTSWILEQLGNEFSIETIPLYYFKKLSAL